MRAISLHIESLSYYGFDFFKIVLLLRLLNRHSYMMMSMFFYFGSMACIGWNKFILYCIVLYCIVLYCIVLYCIVWQPKLTCIGENNCPMDIFFICYLSFVKLAGIKSRTTSVLDQNRPVTRTTSVLDQNRPVTRTTSVLDQNRPVTRTTSVLDHNRPVTRTTSVFGP